MSVTLMTSYLFEQIALPARLPCFGNVHLFLSSFGFSFCCIGCCLQIHCPQHVEVKFAIKSFSIVLTMLVADRMK